MKIAILSRYQNEVNRGVESVVSELSKRLIKNHQVDIYSGKESDDIQKIISKKYDIVMPTNGRMQSFKTSLGRFPGKYKLVIGGHSGIGKDDIFNIAICKPDLFIGLTDYMADWAKHWGWGSKIVKINNGVNLDRFKPEGPKLKIDLPQPIILSVGALNWYKGHDKVIKAVSRIKKGSLLIVGDGPDKEKLTNLGNSLLKDRFKIIKLDYQQMPEVYRAVDLFTLGSWNREAFGVVYLEAMATNLAVVAPNDSPRREIIGRGGILTSIDNPEKFAEDLEIALSKDWTNLPRTQAEKFSWDKIAKEYERCFLDIVKI